MKDRSLEVKLLKYKIFGEHYQNQRRVHHIEMLLFELVQRAEEDTNLKFEDNG